MTQSLRLAVTADLHWGPNPRGNEATRQLVAQLAQDPPSLLLLAGDVGAGEDFGPALDLFDALPCRKALVPGNHDIWVTEDDERGDSLRVYREQLPALCQEHDFHYLDGGPLLLREHDMAIVGTMNWYDYSWSIDRLREMVPDWEDRLRTKTFSRGRHNDARFVRWPFNDISFTAEIVATFERHLVATLAEVSQVVVVTHHPPVTGLSFPQLGPASLDSLLWRAFAGNAAIEAILHRHVDRIPLLFCGHTHRARECHGSGQRGYNVGGDYHFKRLLRVDVPGGDVTATVFGDP
jgi:predicted phosphohydrolase